MKRLPLPLWLIFRTNLLKTIFFNLKKFPLKTARKLPIVFIGKVNTSDCTGRIVFSEPLYTGMVIVGDMPNDICSYHRYYPMRFKVAGTLVLGSHVHIRGGGVFNVSRNGNMTIGNDVIINCYSRVWCTNEICLGNNIRISWECQLFDSNFHYIIDSEGYTKKCNGKVLIGDNAWIGNRVTINKGTVIPQSSIVSSCSFVNKDFSEYGERIMIGGCPAKYIKSGFRRLFNRQKQIETDEYFINNPEAINVYIGDSII